MDGDKIAQLIADEATLEIEAKAKDATIERLLRLLNKLTNEVGGTVMHPQWEGVFRSTAGNTNFQCLKKRWLEAKAALEEER